MTFKKIVGKIHLWLGLSSGLVVCILGITGCLFCFEKEIKNWVYADKIFVQPQAAPLLSADTLRAIAQAQLGASKPIGRVEIKPDGKHSYKFIALKSNKKATNYNAQFPYYKTIYLNPYSGAVLDVENTKWTFFPVLLHLHYDLLLGKIGHQIVGWSTVIFVLMLITGIILWWPKNKAAAKQRFWFRWKNTTKWKRKNYDLHNIPGFYSLFITLFIASTGLYFAFDWFRQPVLWIANGGKMPAKEAAVFSDTLLTNRGGVLQNIVSQSFKAIPKGQNFLFLLPETADKKAVIRTIAYHNANNYIQRSQLAFDQTSGALLKNKPYAKVSDAEKLQFMIYDIHVGKVLGLPGMTLAFCGSLMAASLPITGFYIWWGRRKKQKRSSATPLSKVRKTQKTMLVEADIETL